MSTLNQSLRTLLLTTSLAIAGQAVAQLDAGFIGHRYVGAGFFLESVHDSAVDSGTGFSGSANVPINEFLDFSGSAYYERFGEFNLRDKRVSGSVVAYKDLDYFKPFVELGLAGTWQSSTINGRDYKSHDGIYVAGLGVEAIISRQSALFLRAAYNKYFDSSNGDYWTYSGGINTWFNERVGGVFSVAFHESTSTVVSFTAVFRF